MSATTLSYRCPVQFGTLIIDCCVCWRSMVWQMLEPKGSPPPRLRFVMFGLNSHFVCTFYREMRCKYVTKSCSIIDGMACNVRISTATALRSRSLMGTRSGSQHTVLQRHLDAGHLLLLISVITFASSWLRAPLGPAAPSSLQLLPIKRMFASLELWGSGSSANRLKKKKKN